MLQLPALRIGQAPLHAASLVLFAQLFRNPLRNQSKSTKCVVSVLSCRDKKSRVQSQQLRALFESKISWNLVLDVLVGNIRKLFLIKNLPL